MDPRQQYISLRQQGLSHDKALAKSRPTPTGSDYRESGAGVLDAVFGGGKIGESIGSGLAQGRFGKILQRISTGRDLTDAESRSITNDVTPGQFVGSGLRSAALFTPVGRVAGVVTPLMGRTAAGVVSAAIAGYASDVGSNLQSKKSNFLMPGSGTVVAGGVPIAGAATRAFGSSLRGIGEKVININIKPSSVDLADGFSLTNIEKYKIKGTLQQMLDKAQTEVVRRSTALDSIMDRNPEKININGIVNKTAERLSGDKLGGFGSNKQLQTALGNLREEVRIVATDGQVSLADAQRIKQAAGYFGAWKWNLPDPESKASERVYNSFYNVIKMELEKKGGPEVRALNTAMSEIIPIVNALIRRVPVAQRNQALSLADMVTLTGATFNPSSALLTLINVAQRSTAIGGGLRDIGTRLQRGATPGPALEGLGRAGLNIISRPQNQQ